MKYKNTNLIASCISRLSIYLANKTCIPCIERHIQNEDKQIKNTSQKTKIMSNTEPIKHPGMNTGVLEW